MGAIFGSLSLAVGAVMLLLTPSLLCCFDTSPWIVGSGGGLGVLLGLAGVVVAARNQYSGLAVSLVGLALSALATAMAIMMPTDPLGIQAFRSNTSGFPQWNTGIATTPYSPNPVLVQTSGTMRVEVKEVRIIRGEKPELDTLFILLSIQNTSATTPLKYTPWNALLPETASANALPRLSDNNKRKWTWVRPTGGAAPTVTLDPLATTQEELTFRADQVSAGNFTLQLRTPPQSEQGQILTFSIPEDRVVQRRD